MVRRNQIHHGFIGFDHPWLTVFDHAPLNTQKNDSLFIYKKIVQLLIQ